MNEIRKGTSQYIKDMVAKEFINNDIEESYCSFEVSKLLKEKGFKCPVNRYFKNKIPFSSSFLVREIDAAMHPDEGKNGVEVFADSDRLMCNYNWEKDDEFVSRPTHSLAIEWIRVNFGLYLHFSIIGDEYTLVKDAKWSVSVSQNTVYNFKWGSKITEGVDYFNSYQEAMEAALLYILTNLIK